MAGDVPEAFDVLDARSRSVTDSVDSAFDAAVRDGLQVIRRVPLNAETPDAALAAAVTSTPQVYVRTNFDIPALDSRTHRIHVDGAVAAPFTFGVDDLASLEQTTIIATMECAGNDRTAIVPPVAGEPWTGGAVSTVRWTGVSLRTMLERAGVEGSAVDVVFEGADQGGVDSVPGTTRFARSLSVGDALHPDTLLATGMNGAPLAARYGAPVRLVVPGWFGMASVKWLRRIEVITSPFDGYFQTRRYVYSDGEHSRPVTRMRVKSLIVDPAPDSVIPPGITRIRGWAWSGEGPITAVDVSAGSEWQPARLHPPESASAWTRWEIDLDLRGAGPCTLRSRARDAGGNLQPDHPPWNLLGYGNNAIRQMVVNLIPIAD